MQLPKGRYILYADDDPDDIVLFQEYINPFEEWEVLTVRNGQEALDFLSRLSPEQYPALIVLDINMPLMGGWETLEALKAQETYREIPVVMFSTARSEEERAKSKPHGVPYLTKPTTAQEAERVAATLLRYGKGLE